MGTALYESCTPIDNYIHLDMRSLLKVHLLTYCAFFPRSLGDLLPYYNAANNTPGNVPDVGLIDITSKRAGLHI